MAARLIAGSKTPTSPAPTPEQIYGLPRDNPILASEEAKAKRREAAMSMMDDETYGYVLITLRKKPGNAFGKLKLQLKLERAWWPAFSTMLRKVARTLEG